MDSPDIDAYVTAADEDQSWAERITKSLADRGRTLMTGAAAPTVSSVSVSDFVGRARNLVVVWSPAATSSEFVERDIARFGQMRSSAEQARGLIFVLVKDASLPDYQASQVIWDLVRGDRKWDDAREVPKAVWARVTDGLTEALDRVSWTASKQQADEPAIQQANAPAGRPVAGVDPIKQYNLFRSVQDILGHASELKGARRGAI